MPKIKNIMVGLLAVVIVTTSVAITTILAASVSPINVAATNKTQTPNQSFKDSIIVKFKAGSDQQKSTKDISSKLFGVASVSGDSDILKSSNLAVVKPESGQNPDRILATLKLNPLVETAQYNYPYQSQAYTPNDPSFATGQWNLQDSASGIYMPSAWEAVGRKITANNSLVCSEATPTCGGVNTVKVAVIDSGINVASLPGSNIDTANSVRFYVGNGCQPGETSLGDFPANSGQYYCRTNGSQYDDDDHGTRVASIIGMADDSSDGIGTGYNTQILPIAVDKNSLNTLNIIFGLEYAMNKGAKVVNLSLGSPFNDPVLEFWINKVTDAGVVVVASSGNCGNSISQNCFNFGSSYVPGDEQYGVFNPRVYPAYYQNVISVGALNWNSSSSSFSRSSYSTYNDQVDVAVPVDINGVGSILTKCSSSSSCTTTNNQGTSFAAPQVAGVAALLVSSEAGLSPIEIKGRIKAATDVIGTQSQEYGTGKVNACKTVLGCGGINYPAKYYYTWNDSVGGTQTWTLLSNPSSTNYIRARIQLKNKIDDIIIISPLGIVTPQFSNIADGPIIISVENGADLVTTQRSFTVFNSSVEYPGIDANTLDSKYYFTWYDSKDGTQSWTLIGNPSSSAIKVRLTIGDQTAPLVDQIYTINPGQSIAPQFANIQAGPVVVQGLNFSTQLPDTNTKLYTTQRTFTKFKSSWEYAGIPASTLDSRYYFTWNDTKNGTTTWTLVGNPTSSDIKVRIKVGNQVNPAINQVFTVPAGKSIAPVFPNMQDGPILVEGLNSNTLSYDNTVKFYTTQRVFTVFNSSNEYAGIPQTGLGTKFYLTWNDTDPGNSSWTLVGNPSITQSVQVRIRVGNPGSPLVDQTYNIPAGGRITPIYPGIVTGPIVVESLEPGKNIFVTQRIFTKFRFSGEYGGITR
ncbi:MAG: S8 family serine peptidase [bacterium]